MNVKVKKTLLIVALLVLALGALGVGVVAAQEGNSPYGQRGVADGTGYMHDYMEKALAEAVGLTESKFKIRHSAGETFYQIALAEGFAAEEISTLMQEARANALEAAAKDGVISQDQADWMQSRGFGRGGMMNGGGYGNGDCPMFEDSQNAGAGIGRGGMMHGWGGQK